MFSALTNRVRKNQGFTLIEAIIAISIFLVIITATSGIFTDAFASQRKAEVSKIVYEEGRIALERIVKEMRRGTIDYEEYWNRFKWQSTETDNQFYGLNYGDYARYFYRDANGLVPDPVTRLDENIGVNADVAPLGDASSLAVCTPPFIPTAVTDFSGYEQCELYLITADGTEKTVFKLIPEFVGTDREYHLEMLKLEGRDYGDDGIVATLDTGESDGQIDSWVPAVDFCSAYAAGVCTTRQFQKIQPDSIQITSLKFFVAPLEDPRKAFAEFTDDIQQQPHVMIEMTVNPSASRAHGVRGEIPSITLQTTVGARAQNEVKSLP
ncbi:MAG: type II secretion system protein [Patescibacteria group bacterium]